jgi:hypothetical protein
LHQQRSPLRLAPRPASLLQRPAQCAKSKLRQKFFDVFFFMIGVLLSEEKKDFFWVSLCSSRSGSVTAWRHGGNN